MEKEEEIVQLKIFSSMGEMMYKQGEVERMLYSSPLIDSGLLNYWTQQEVALKKLLSPPPG